MKTLTVVFEVPDSVTQEDLEGAVENAVSFADNDGMWGYSWYPIIKSQ